MSFLDYSVSGLLLIIFLTLALFIRNKICELSPRIGGAQTLQSDKSHRPLLNLVPGPVDADLSTVLFTLSWSFAHRHVRQQTGNACCLCERGTTSCCAQIGSSGKPNLDLLNAGENFPRKKKESCVSYERSINNSQTGTHKPNRN